VRSFLGVPIATEGRPYGLFCVTENIGKGEFGADAERVAMTLTAQLAVAYENLRRYDEIQEHAAHLTRVMAERKQAEEEILASRARLAQLSRQLIATQENERRHLARELHDEIGQILTAVFYNLNALKAARDSITLSRVDESLAVVDQAIQQVRNLSLDLRPSMLDDHGLAPTIKWYVDRLAQQTGLTIHLTAPPSGVDMLPEVKIACFRVAQEAMTNVVRHARAKQVWIELNQSEEEVRLDIRDDGIGFDVAAARGRALRGGSVGLLGMQERVELVSGQFVVESRPGRGTTVLVRFDVDKLEEKRAKIDTSGGVNDEAYPDLAGR
jgi:signal transduction histidine kinase